MQAFVQKIYRADPRYYQIAVLGALLIYGLCFLQFEIQLLQALVILSSVLVFQYLATKIWKLEKFDPRSALISGLSLCLLLRTNFIALNFSASFITIFSKFTLRFNGKHIFNPTNFGIVLLLLFTENVWVSPGQWGNIAFFAFLMACLGGMVVNRAMRSDVAIAFIIFYLGFVFYRSWYLGEPFTIPLHRLESGALLLFTFFMISDPKTTPNSRIARILFAFFVAAGAYYVQFKLFRTNGVLWSLALFSIMVPLLDKIFPGSQYDWKKGNSHEEKTHSPRPASLHSAPC